MPEAINPWTITILVYLFPKEMYRVVVVNSLLISVLCDSVRFLFVREIVAFFTNIKFP